MGDENIDPEELVVLWTTEEREVMLKMIFMYLLNAARKGQWKKIRLISWGPSSHLASIDEEVQDRIRTLHKEGVLLQSCRTCAEMYRVVEDLQKLGFDVILMGELLTEYLKKGKYRVVTF